MYTRFFLRTGLQASHSLLTEERVFIDRNWVKEVDVISDCEVVLLTIAEVVKRNENGLNHISVGMV